ncbi:MAG: glycosyltransferase family 4 protein [Acidobacteriia bacterium]|nr:glycosyltransferase family 4 protein [Terriglobia bacterium]
MTIELLQETAAGTAPRAAVKPVPILLTVRELNLGGIERDVTQIALNIDRTRFAPHVASYRSEGMRLEELRAAGVPLLHLPVTSLKSPSAVSAALGLRRYIREHGIGLVHAYDSSAVFAAPIARALGVPAVLTSTLGHRSLLDARTRRLVRWTDRIVDAVVVNCEAMRRHMIDEEHAPEERIEFCYNGVDTSVFYPRARRPERGSDVAFVIGAVCVLRPEKSIDLLQEAFARARHLRPGMKLRIVGSGPELAKLQANSRRLEIQDDCEFVPATRQVAELLRGFDIYVSSSRSEAFSNTILEAMASGCCVVGSRVGGTPELIGEERGLLFEAGDAADLAARLAALVQNEPQRRALGRRAAEFAGKMFTIEIAAKRMAEIYEMILLRKAVR